MIVLKGKGVCRGIAMGSLHYIDRIDSEAAQYKVANIGAEFGHFDKAIDDARDQFNRLYCDAKHNSHCEILNDPDFLETAKAIIKKKNANAAVAVCEAGKKFAAVFPKKKKLYKEICNRVVRNLNTEIYEEIIRKAGQLPPHILAADDLSEDEADKMEKYNLLGFITMNVSEDSHATNVAKSMNLPAVIGIGDVNLKHYEGAFVIVDGDTGDVYINPTPKIIKSTRDKLFK